MPNTPAYRLTNRDLVFAIRRVRPILKQLTGHAYHGGNESGTWHTINEVLEATKELAEETYGSTGHPLAIEAMIAAVYHDVGMTLDPRTYVGHEQRSATYMAIDLSAHHPGLPEWQIDRMMQTVIETNPTLPATSQNARILKDADLAYLGRFTPEVAKRRCDDLRNEVLRYEHPFLTAKAISDRVWNELQVEFISNPELWQTSAARKLYDSKRMQTLQLMKKIASRHVA